MAACPTEHCHENDWFHALHKGCQFSICQFVGVGNWRLPCLLVTLSVKQKFKELTPMKSSKYLFLIKTKELGANKSNSTVE